MTTKSDINIKHWFIDHVLPWSQQLQQTSTMKKLNSLNI